MRTSMGLHFAMGSQRFHGVGKRGDDRECLSLATHIISGGGQVPERSSHKLSLAHSGCLAPSKLTGMLGCGFLSHADSSFQQRCLHCWLYRIEIEGSSPSPFPTCGLPSGGDCSHVILSTLAVTFRDESSAACRRAMSPAKPSTSSKINPILILQGGDR